MFPQNITEMFSRLVTDTMYPTVLLVTQLTAHWSMLTSCSSLIEGSPQIGCCANTLSCTDQSTDKVHTVVTVAKETQHRDLT